MTFIHKTENKRYVTIKVEYATMKLPWYRYIPATFNSYNKHYTWKRASNIKSRKEIDFWMHLTWSTKVQIHNINMKYDIYEELKNAKK